MARVHLSFTGFESCVDELPTPLSRCSNRLQQAATDGNCLAALWLLRDAVECCVRLLVAAGMAEVIENCAEDEAWGDRVVPLLKPLIGTPTLGIWVGIARALASDDGGPVGKALARIKADRDGCWFELFDSSTKAAPNFVTFRNDTIGHGAYASEEEYAGGVARFLPALAAFVCAAHHHLWSRSTIRSRDGGIIWRGAQPSGREVGGETGWVGAELCVEGKKALLLDPFARGHRVTNEETADLLLFHALEQRGKKSVRTLADFTDYLRGRFQNADPLGSHVVDRCLKFKSFDGGPSVSAAARLPRRKRALPPRPLPWLEERLANWAKDVLFDKEKRSQDRGAYAHIIGPPGTGKTWFARQIPFLVPDGRPGHFSLNSPLHTGRSLRLLYSSADDGSSVNAFWSTIGRQVGEVFGLATEEILRGKQTSLDQWAAELFRRQPGSFGNGFLVFVLDGLDEMPNSLDACQRLTALFTPLPARCLAILLSRGGLRSLLAADLVRLERREGARFGRFGIDPQSDDNKGVQRTFLEDLGVDADKMFELSNGVFLYSHHFAEAFIRGVFAPNESPRRQELYARILDHLRQRVGDDLYDRVYLRLLGAVLAARAPLTASMLRRHWGLTADGLGAPLDDLAFLVHEGRDRHDENAYRSSHQIVVEALLDSHDVNARLPSIHAEYADTAYREIYGGSQPDPWKDREPQDDSPLAYALLHLPYHLRAAGDKRRTALVERDPSRRRALLDLGRALRDEGHVADALAVWTVAIECHRKALRGGAAKDGSLRRAYADALLEQASMLETVGRYRQAMAVSGLAAKQAALVPAEQGGPTMEAKAGYRAAYAAYLACDYRKAGRLYDRALEALESVAAPEAEIARCELGRAEVRYILDDFDAALATCDRLSRSPALVDEAALQAEVNGLRGRVMIELASSPDRDEDSRLRCHQDADEAFRRALDAFRNLKKREREKEADILSFRSDVALALGRVDDAWEQASLAFEAYRQFPDPMGCCEVAWTLGEIARKQERYDEAERWLAESIRFGEECASPGCLFDPLVGLARAVLAQGRREEAIPHVERAFQISRDLGHHRKAKDIAKLLKEMRAGRGGPAEP